MPKTNRKMGGLIYLLLHESASIIIRSVTTSQLKHVTVLRGLSLAAFSLIGAAKTALKVTLYFDQLTITDNNRILLTGNVVDDIRCTMNLTDVPKYNANAAVSADDSIESRKLFIQTWPWYEGIMGNVFDCSNRTFTLNPQHFLMFHKIMSIMFSFC